MPQLTPSGLHKPFLLSGLLLISVGLCRPALGLRPGDCGRWLKLFSPHDGLKASFPLSAEDTFWAFVNGTEPMDPSDNACYLDGLLMYLKIRGEHGPSSAKALSNVLLQNNDWSSVELKAAKLVPLSYPLKNGDSADQIRYLSAQKILLVSGLPLDPDLEKTCLDFLRDPQRDPRVREQAFQFLWLDRESLIAPLLGAVERERRNEWSEKIASDVNHLAHLQFRPTDISALLIGLPRHPDLIEKLLRYWVPGHEKPALGLVRKVIENETQSDSEKLKQVEHLRRSLLTRSLEEAASYLSAYQTNDERISREVLAIAFKNNFRDLTQLAREIEHGSLHPDAGVRDFAYDVFKRVSRTPDFPLPSDVLIGADLNARQQQQSRWLRDPSIASKSKVAYLKLNLLNPNLSTLLSQVPAKQQRYVQAGIRIQNNVATFRKLAEERQKDPHWFSQLSPESFEFVAVKFPARGKKIVIEFTDGEHHGRVFYTLKRAFAVQKTAVTQAQWELVMGQNPSKNIGDPRRPVENITWYSALYYANELSRLEGLQPVYEFLPATFSHPSPKTQAAAGGLAPWNSRVFPKVNPNANGYRLLTEAEREFISRNEPHEAPEPSPSILQSDWLSPNAGGSTHEVATLRPNHLGVFDLRGNVFEWLFDGAIPYNNSVFPNGSTDPVVTNASEYRVVGGASYLDFPEWAIALPRTRRSPTDRFPNLGLRLARPLE
jgi:hypothetical protein